VYKLLAQSAGEAIPSFSNMGGLAYQADSYFGLQVSHFWVLVVLYSTLTAWYLLASVEEY